MGISSGTEPEPLRDRVRDHGFHPVRVSRVIAETPDAVSIALDVTPELDGLFAYRAGQFVTFRLTIDGEPQLRSYSMSSSPDVDDEFLVTVKRVRGGVVSTWLTQRLTPDDVIETTRPAGVFTLDDSRTGDLIAFAGGSGITPVYSLLKTALATTARRVRLLYANRDRDGVIFREQLAALAGRYPDRLELELHLDSENGFVDPARIGAYASGSPDGEYYVCGPGPFMDLIAQSLHDHDITDDRIHIERFTPTGPTVLPNAEPSEAAVTPGDATVSEITIKLDGKTKTAPHRPGTTVLQTARSMGMTPPFSCEAGDCATCMAKVLEGAADMFVNNALLPEEVTDGWILTCQAVPTTPSISVEYGYGD